MGVGRWRGAGWALALDFEIFSKKSNFSKKKVIVLVSSGKNQISPLLAHHGKILEKSPSSPPWKNPSDAHGYRYVGVSASAVSANVT